MIINGFAGCSSGAHVSHAGSDLWSGLDKIFSCDLPVICPT
jgi:hypothetical protein